MPLDIPLFRLDWAGKFHGGKMDPNLYWIVGEHSLDPSPVSFAYTVIIVGGAFLVEPPHVGLEAQPTVIPICEHSHPIGVDWTTRNLGFMGNWNPETINVEKRNVSGAGT